MAPIIFYYVRHTKAHYKYINAVTASDNPCGPIDFSKQNIDDAPESGIELAQNKSQAFFHELKPEGKLIFFGSSNEARAYQTAQIFLAEAIKQKFEIGDPKEGMLSRFRQYTSPQIRKIHSLSIKSKNNLLDCIYNPPAHFDESIVNWDAVIKNPKFGQKFKDTWETARKDIVLADDKGSWGGNFGAHSEGVKKYFESQMPQVAREIKSRVDSFETDFKNTLRLVRFCAKKLAKKHPNFDKKVVLLGFSHEQAVMYFLYKYFPDKVGLPNCDAIKLEFNADGLTVTHTGIVKNIENL
ncbi:MAG: hypothetical protein KKG59_06495 [Nanoarchaeota archaeon]|nr:hypothetical protein [Nanoarchaeota archaeon]